MSRKVLVCGGRSYMDQQHVWSVLEALHKEAPIGLIVEGGADGADCWAMTWAHSNQIDVREYKANWKEYGPRAGPLRNVEMLIDSQPDLVVAFPGGKGTAHMIGIARAQGYTVLVAEPVNPA